MADTAGALARPLARDDRVDGHAGDDRSAAAAGADPRPTAGEAVWQPTRHVPLLEHAALRAAVGLVLLALSVPGAEMALRAIAPNRVPAPDGSATGSTHLAAVLGATWLAAVVLTDKYRHKYPHRYFSYLVASHFKAAVTMAVPLAAATWLLGTTARPEAAWTAFVLFVVADALASAPRRVDRRPAALTVDDLLRPAATAGGAPSRSTGLEAPDPQSSPVQTAAVLSEIGTRVSDPGLVGFLRKHLPDRAGGNDRVLVVDDVPPGAAAPRDQAPRPALLVGARRLNHVRRFHRFLLFCNETVAHGGFVVVRYVPLETEAQNLRRRWPGALRWPAAFLHFVCFRGLPKLPLLDKLYFSPLFAWIDRAYFSVAKKRNRVLSKAEVWGHFAYCGMPVLAEERTGGDEVVVIAQRVAPPVEGKVPSYYPVVALEKVGLNGETLRTHKVRTMFPFSEFLQKRVFEDHGLAETGKFRNDFRLTSAGKFLRKYWLDELPQLFDWLRGDVKLVGMRATSRHFLSLYPRSVLDLYLQIKPGLVPPIFDDSTGGLEAIIEVERTYLERYKAHPWRTDVRYFFKTFTDIVFRGVRSK